MRTIHTSHPRRPLHAWSILTGSRKLVAAALSLVAAASLLPTMAAAQEFPSKPIRFIVPFAPGSITDVAARFYAKRLTALGGQPVFVENRPGANGLIGVQATLGSPADGYTILVGTTSTLATNVALYRRLPYDPVADFAPLSTMTAISTILVAPKDSPYRNAQELIKAAKAQPGKINYAAGASSYHLMGELFKEVTATSNTHVPYKGSSEALRAAISKEVDFAVLDASTALGAIRGGSVQGLMIASEKRLGQLPDVPTSGESGVDNYTASTWVAAVAPAGVPKATLERLQKLLTAIADEKETHDFFAGIGAQMLPSGPQALGKLITENITLWKRVATNANIELM